MEVRGYRGAAAFDGTTVTLTKRGGDVVQFPAECVCAAWVDRVGHGLRSLEFTVAGGGTVTTYRMVFSWRWATELAALRYAVMTARLYGSRKLAGRERSLAARVDPDTTWPEP
jgi:hypothetical protein